MNKRKKALRRNWNPITRRRLRPARYKPPYDEETMEAIKAKYPKYSLVGIIKYPSLNMYNPVREIPVWRKVV